MTWDDAIPIVVVVMSVASLIYTMTLARLQAARLKQIQSDEIYRVAIQANEILKARVAELESKQQTGEK
jgi:hypothetical protein